MHFTSTDSFNPGHLAMFPLSSKTWPGAMCTAPGPALWPQQLQAGLQVWDRVPRRLCERNRPGSVGPCSAEHEPTVYPGGQGGQWHPH